MESYAERMFELFSGLDRAYGIYRLGKVNSDSGKVEGSARTLLDKVTLKLWEDHLAGAAGLGITPIRADNTCLWGAIDIDIYDLSLNQLEVRVKELGAPLTLFRTKSGGAHLYLFLTEPVPAYVVQAKLKEFAKALGYPTAEVFPKQVKLASDKDTGNWINMPYFDYKKTMRYAIRDGVSLTLPEFLLVADSLKVSEAQLVQLKLNQIKVPDDYRDAPPCIVQMFKNGVNKGGRNECLYNMAVYARMKYPDEWEDKVDEYNEKFIIPPLEEREVETVKRQNDKKDYFYRCTSNPFSAFCNKDECKKAEYGVGRDSDEESVPIVLDKPMTKIRTNPAILIIGIEGYRVMTDTKTFADSGAFRLLVMEKTDKVIPRFKTARWDKVVSLMHQNIQEVEVPKEVTPEGQLLTLLESYCTGKMQAKLKEELIKGKPWTHEGKTYFKGNDFYKFITQQGFKEMSLQKVWYTIKHELGGTDVVMRVLNTTQRLWCVPEFVDKQTEEFTVPDVTDSTV